MELQLFIYKNIALHFYYSKDSLINKQVIVVTNLPPKKIGPFVSECLITGFYRDDKKVVLAIPESLVPNGTLLA